MRGSCCLHAGVLYIGLWDKTAHVAAFDLDGRDLGQGFSLRDAEHPVTSVNALAVDLDHRLWIADAAAARVRALTLFGAEVGGIDGDGGERDCRGVPGRPVGIAICEVGGEELLAVASAGTRRHALQLFDVRAGFAESLRPNGDPRDRFRGLTGVAAGGRFLWALEAGAGWIQVYREGEFHFRFRSPGAPAAAPVALAPVGDGRLVVAVDGRDAGGASGLFLLSGGGRPLAQLAAGGPDEGEVCDPAGCAVEPGRDDRHTRVALLDQGGERVQVFNLEGRCYGAFETRGGGIPGSA